MKLRVLIICEKFAPENTVGAIRMTKVAKYLKLNHDCEITVLARSRQADNTLGDARYVDSFVYADEGKIGQFIIKAYKKYSSSDRYTQQNREKCQRITHSSANKKHDLSNLKAYAKSILSVAYSEFIPRVYCKNAVRVLKHSGKEFDVVLSSFGPAASHYVAKKLKKTDPHLIWIADYRDPLAIGESTKGFLHRWAVNFANRITGSADAITVASNGFVQCLGLMQASNVHVINNGYDKDEFKCILCETNQPHEKMRLVYTGTLFAGSRDITVILKALNELISDGELSEDRIELIYAGQHRKEFLYQFGNSGLKVNMEAYDVIPKADALRIQNSADLLLIAAWNTEEYKGSLPLKVYEYLYVGKPIVCSILGTAGDSELKKIIEDCSAGCCYEACNHDTDYIKLKHALLEYYKEFTTLGYVTQKPEGLDQAAVSKFDYKTIAEQFYDLMQASGGKQ